MQIVLLVASAVLLSCAEPSLEIRFVIPDGYKDMVTSTSLSVLVPPQGTPFDCDDIAFGMVDDAQIAANTVEDVRLADQGASTALRAIPRKEDKLLLALGYDNNGQELVAGCANVGVISDGMSVSVEGEIVTLAAIVNFDPLRTRTRSENVRITDVLGQSVPGITVRWTSTAPGSNPTSDTAKSDQEGTVTIPIAAGALPGPIATEVSARWARSAPPVISSFETPSLLFRHDLEVFGEPVARNPDEIYQVGRVGPNGEVGLAVMGQANGSSSKRRVHIAYYSASLRDFVTIESDLLPSSAISLGLVPDTDRDRIITTSFTSLIEINADGSLATTAIGVALPLVRRYFPSASCSESPTFSNYETILVSADGASRALRGAQLVISPFAGANAPGKPIASGCVSNAGTLHRAIVYTNASATTLVADMDGIRKAKLSTLTAGMAFGPSSESEEALLLANTLSIAGTDITRFRIGPIDSDKLAVELVTSDATPTIPQSTTAGDFDGDGVLDIASVLVFGDSRDAGSYRIYISMGMTTRSGRVVGVSEANDGQRPRIFARDFNEDGYDDLLIASSLGYEIFSMGPKP